MAFGIDSLFKFVQLCKKVTDKMTIKTPSVMVGGRCNRSGQTAMQD